MPQGLSGTFEPGRRQVHVFEEGLMQHSSHVSDQDFLCTTRVVKIPYRMFAARFVMFHSNHVLFSWAFSCSTPVVGILEVLLAVRVCMCKDLHVQFQSCRRSIRYISRPHFMFSKQDFKFMGLLEAKVRWCREARESVTAKSPGKLETK